MGRKMLEENDNNEEATRQAYEAIPAAGAALHEHFRPAREHSFNPGGSVQTLPLRQDAPKVGRNDPCPCGSGKKFKRCCGDVAKMH